MSNYEYAMESVEHFLEIAGLIDKGRCFCKNKPACLEAMERCEDSEDYLELPCDECMRAWLLSEKKQ